MEEKQVIKIVSQILSTWGEKYAIQARANLEAKKGVATGRLLNSINYEIETRDTIVSLHINMEDYAQFVNDGRAAGKFPPLLEIENWIKTRGITMKRKPKGLKGITREREVKTLAFLIGRKIARVGTRPKKFLPKVELSLLREQISKALKLYLTVDLVTEVKRIVRK